MPGPEALKAAAKAGLSKLHTEVPSCLNPVLTYTKAVAADLKKRGAAALTQDVFTQAVPKVKSAVSCLGKALTASAAATVDTGVTKALEQARTALNRALKATASDLSSALQKLAAPLKALATVVKGSVGSLPAPEALKKALEAGASTVEKAVGKCLRSLLDEATKLLGEVSRGGAAALTATALGRVKPALAEAPRCLSDAIKAAAAKRPAKDAKTEKPKASSTKPAAGKTLPKEPKEKKPKETATPPKTGTSHKVATEPQPGKSKPKKKEEHKKTGDTKQGH